MKKCPECGNPSYDGAPVCGNCGFKFPKPKVAVRKEESIFEKQPKAAVPKEESIFEKQPKAAVPKDEKIFEKQPKVQKSSSNESTISIIKQRKLLIGAILLITLIVIFAIVLTGSNDSKPSIETGDTNDFSQGDFSFKYPANWEEYDGKDSEHAGAKFFKNENNTIIEYYNSTMDSTSLKEITQSRISYAQQSGSAVELVETITLDGRNTSNVILENANGDYTRFVSMFSDGKLYVFKMSGDSINSITSPDIESMLSTADIA